MRMRRLDRPNIAAIIASRIFGVIVSMRNYRGMFARMLARGNMIMPCRAGGSPISRICMLMLSALRGLFLAAYAVAVTVIVLGVAVLFRTARYRAQLPMMRIVRFVGLRPSMSMSVIRLYGGTFFALAVRAENMHFVFHIRLVAVRDRAMSAVRAVAVIHPLITVRMGRRIVFARTGGKR